MEAAFGAGQPSNTYWIISRDRRISLFSKMSRPTLGPKQPPIQQVSGALSLGRGDKVAQA